jgi:general secretion pathway protein I
VKKIPDPLRQGGFSLLEVLVAFSILALCLGILLRIFAGGGRLAGLADEHVRAMILAESLLARAGVEEPLQPGETGGEIDDQFRWRLRVSPYIPAGEPLPEQLPFKPYWVELSVEWGQQELRSFTLSTLRLLAETRQPRFQR